MGYVEGESVVHRLDPRTKIIILACTLLVSLAAKNWTFLLALFLLNLGFFFMARVGLRTMSRRMRFFIVFGGMIFLSFLIFDRTGPPIYSFLFPPEPLPGIHITLYSGGLENGLLVVLRFLNIVLSSMIFVATTRPSRLAHSLMRSGLPYRYGYTLLASLRFIPAFDSESNMVQYAQRARGLDIDSGGVRGLWKQVRYTLTPLLHSAMSRIDSLAMSMDARGMGMHPHRTYIQQCNMGRLDFAGIILCLAATALFFTTVFVSAYP